MATIKLTVDSVVDGQSLTFKAPCDCTAVTGITIGSTTYTFKDAHGNDLSGMGNLFLTGAYVKVVLDTTNNYAYIQNADTNKYLENNKVPTTRKVNGKALSADITLTAADVNAAAKSSSVEVTLTSSAWSSGAQTVSVTGLGATQNGVVGVSKSATADQREAARAAALSVTAQAAGSLTITADGDVPTVNIPLTVTLMG